MSAFQIASILPRLPAKLLALGLGVLLILIAEGSLRLAGFGGSEIGEDPFVGFSAVEPLFALNPLSNRYDIRPERSIYFVRNGFPRYKKTDTFRIFVFGGSTVQGRPYSIETAFPEWLRINLELAYPDMTFEVVNCGGVSYASYRLVPIIRECLEYNPDLFILCTGQNEFLEARTYARIKVLAKPLGRSLKAIRTLATYQAMDGLYQTLSGSIENRSVGKKPTMKMEVDALLDYRRGLSAYRRDPEWREGVIEHFKENIRRIGAICENASVPLMILNPPYNLKDSPPFKSEPSNRLNSEQEREISRIMENYRGQAKLDPIRAAQYLTRLSNVLDVENAASHFTLGHCYLLLGNDDKAAAHLNKALEEDICPLRILPEMRRFLESLASGASIPYIDLQTLLLQHSESPIMGDEMLLDHIHPSVRGHQIIAETITGTIMRDLLRKPAASEWVSARPPAYKAHFQSLDDLYFSHGDLRLENLRSWTRGMADGPPIETHSPIGSN